MPASYAPKKLHSKVTITLGHEGAIPRDLNAVQFRPGNSFLVQPGFQPEECDNRQYNARLSLRILNPKNEASKISLGIDWGGSNHALANLGHSHILTPCDANWRMIPGLENGSIVEYQLEVPPGITRFADSPEYLQTDLNLFLNRIKSAGALVEEAGRSREQRTVPLITLPSANPAAAVFFLQARDHGYETAGSYCVEGAVEFLLGDHDVARYLRNRFVFQILPMTNVDGVANGLTRFTRQTGGADLNRVHTRPDAAHDVIRGTLDRCKPMVYLNIHNWTRRFADGLLANEPEMADAFLDFFPNDSARFKNWRVEKSNARYASSQSMESWKSYCKREFGSIGLTLEFPWFCRSVDDMRRIGKRAVCATAMAALRLAGR